MRPVEEIRSELYRIAGQSDADLAAAALWIAAEEYPDLDPQAYLRYLDDVAATVERRVAAAPDPDAARDALSDEMFVQQGFTGNATEYYDPRNSYLNEVIDRRRGIPISLAVVYLSVGRRLGMPVHGLNAPGHFLVRHGERVLDPFARGRDVAPETLLEQLRQMNVPDPDAHLQRKDFVRSLAVVDRLVHLEPTNPLWLRDRGALYQRLECGRAAVADLERYLELAPDAPESDVLRETIVKLTRNAPPLQ